MNRTPSPSSSSIRRAMPVDQARRSRRRSRTGSPLASERPIAASGSARSIRGIRAARSASAVERDLEPRRDRAAEVLAGVGDGVEVDPGPEVDDDAGLAEALVGGDRVDEAVGADLERVLDLDRHPGLDPGPDEQASRLQVALCRSARTRARAGARPRRRQIASMSPSGISRSASRPASRSASSSPVAPARVWKRQCSTSSPSEKAPTWVWVLPTSTARSIGGLSCPTNGRAPLRDSWARIRR